MACGTAGLKNRWCQAKSTRTPVPPGTGLAHPILAGATRRPRLGLRSPGNCGRGLGRRHRAGCAAGPTLRLVFLRTHEPGQVEAHRRAASHLALNCRDATGLLDQAMHLAEAEARSLSDPLGREERFESTGDDRVRHPGSRVTDRQQDVILGQEFPGASRLPAAQRSPVRMVSRPPSGIASVALMTRLRITWVIWF